MSVFELKMPKLGESVTEGTIGKWLKQPGEKVEKYDLLVEVQTDKVNTEIPSPVAGTLKDVKVKEGDTVPIGALLATFDTADAAEAAPERASGAAGAPPHPDNPAPTPAAATPEVPSAPQRPAAATPPPPQAPRAAPAATQPAPAPQPDGSSSARVATAPPSNGDVRATPVVRKLASEHGVDLDRVQGTGLNGRVTRQDVEQFVAQMQSQPQPQQRQAARPAAAQPEMPQPMAGDEAMPLTQMRKAIANAMVLSKTTIPHAAAMMEIDWTQVAKFRESVRESFKAREGYELTYLPFAIKAVTIALRRNPNVNARWTDQGILKVKAINLGIAISLGDEGLVVPVIKNADDLSITGIARAVRDLATRAKTKKLTIPDFEGGTFTVNNGGTLGTYLSYPIVNPGQAAIMTTEAIGKRVVALDDDSIGIRTMGNVVMSFDHRVMDGATAAAFLRDVKAWIQGVDPSNVALS
ncbi:MAG TPA: dihydrolipoamide acetyltransferase family protein [Candidatus Saccharimonadales bacterium]|nr:dihydrolipoamide acetyltransferase family protein [Candidatus Saccharimonadales bacterium]